MTGTAQRRNHKETDHQLPDLTVIITTTATITDQPLSLLQETHGSWEAVGKGGRESVAKLDLCPKSFNVTAVPGASRLRCLSPHAQCNDVYMGGASCLLS